MFRVAWLIVWAGLGLAGELQTQLDANLDAGKLERSSLASALVAEDVASAEELQQYLDRYEKLIASIQAETNGKGTGKKLAKQLHKSVLATGKLEGEQGDGIRNLLDDKSHTPILATYLMADLAARAKLEESDWRDIREKLESNLSGAAPDAVLGVLLALQAYHLQDADPSKTCRLLRLSKQISPNSGFSWGDLDKLLYNRGLELFNKTQYQAAAQVTIGAATRFPEQKLFYPLAFNLGVKLLEGDKADERNVRDMVRRLHLLMGDHRGDFDKALSTSSFNRGAKLYNAGNFEGALAALEQVQNPPNPEQFKQVLINCYMALAESRLEAGKREEADAMRAKLRALDAGAADELDERLGQLQIKSMVEAGDLTTALAKAATQLNTDIDRNNYKTVLLRYSEDLIAKGQYEKLLANLDKQPAAAQLGDTADNLRFNAYVAWLESFQEHEFAPMLATYRRAFADTKLRMTPENAKLMRENCAIVMHAEIVKLIEDRKFKEADAKSKAALAFAPANPALKQQRQTIETILKRIAE